MEEKLKSLKFLSKSRKNHEKVPHSFFQTQTEIIILLNYIFKDSFWNYIEILFIIVSLDFCIFERVLS